MRVGKLGNQSMKLHLRSESRNAQVQSNLKSKEETSREAIYCMERKRERWGEGKGGVF